MDHYPFLEAHRKAAASVPLRGQFHFSEGTYQIEVKDPKTKESFWPFLQVDDGGVVSDFFCTCATAEKKGSCVHLAVAYRRIFGDYDEPLHVRFRGSLWNALCQMASRRHGYDSDQLKKKDHSYVAVSQTGKQLFSIQGKKELEEILFSRAVETEETSLKFSNLSSEELLLWKQGRPSHQLKYELSFWSDLAKWWMLLQEEKIEYSIKFIGDEETLPKEIQIHFPKVNARFYIAEVNWEQIIPTLKSVKSPLALFEFGQQQLKKIVYDPIEKVFLIDFVTAPSKQELQQPGKGIPIGDYLYYPKIGFYPAQLDPLLQQNLIPQNKIATVLQKHSGLVQKYLVGTKIHPGSVKASYRLFFDKEENLHIQCYLFEPLDLQKPHSAYFGSWVYLEDKGFYLLENLLFEGIERVIPKPLVSDFVNRHRHWLHHYEGFQTHVSTIESKLTYFLNGNGLHFQSRLDVSEEVEGFIDCGDWIYVKGRGFYAKVSGRIGLFLKPGLTVPPQEISRFIQLQKYELEPINGFFSPVMPLERSGLEVKLNKNEEILVKPLFFFKAPYKKDQVQIFGDYTYVAGQGFAEIPPDLRLPERYSKELLIDEIHQPYFVTLELEALRPFILTWDPRLEKPKEFVLQINQVQKDKKTKGGFILNLAYETEIGNVDVEEIWEGLNEKKRYLFTKGGLIFLNQPRFNWLKGLSKKRWISKGNIRLTTLEWIRLSVFEDIREPKGHTPEAEESRKLLEEFRTASTDEPLDLTGLKSKLRPYQETGVRWLWFLYVNGLSGLLCDEMGLGKTHQAMALLAAVSHTKHHYLVICPTSVIFHWEELLKRFLPKLRVCVFYGIQRTLEDFQENYDLLLTSYGTFRSERQAISQIPFEVAIFDEAQIAKNVHSQTHKALRLLDARMKLALTGTPIENRLLELKALFDVVIPSYLPTETQFKELFVNPIEKQQDEERKGMLAKLVKPFVLRRKKTEVLLELPEKTEEIAYCILSDEQRELYKETYLLAKRPLLQDLKDEKKPVPYIHVFALLTTLKQICDHPCLINKKLSEYRKHHSGKWDYFVELLQETRESGQKLVVFSQYLDMLTIIETYLKEEKIGYAGIRGSTRNRKEQLEKFRDDPQCEVFVASLQAAGVGIELVAASVVIHYDRWWNPAKENQATDRVHRMGQSRGVQVFKMVTKHTIEEHIHALIEKKMGLMEGIIGFDDQDQIKGLDREELIKLLQMMDQDLKTS